MRRRTARLGVGTASFLPAYGIGDTEALRGSALIRAAIAAGVRYIDTAAGYGDAERSIGELHALIAREGVRLCTKVSVDGIDRADQLLDRIEQSRERLGLITLDTLLLHSADPDVLSRLPVRQALQRARKHGLVQRVGVSTYGVDAARAASRHPEVDVVQVEYSVLNQSVIRALTAEASRHSEIVARSVLCKGLLTPRWRGAPALTRGLVPCLERLECLAGAWGYDLPSLAIRFALATPGLDIVLVGIGGAEELETALDAAVPPYLTEKQLAELYALDHSHMDEVHPERWESLR